MKKRQWISFVVFGIVLCGCTIAEKTKSTPTRVQPEQIKSVMTKVANWQLANPRKRHTADWTHGALFAGMTAWAQMADSEKYFDALIGFGDKNNWQPHQRIYHADDHAVGQMYIEMYKKYKDPKMIAGIQERFDYILANQPNTPLTHDNIEHKKRWNWCDALFMAPPVLTKLTRLTGDSKYLEYMDKEWWVTTDYLYDTEEHLYFRDNRYFDKREANGEKIFWSRGNGWVIGGLVRVLEEMPEDFPDRGRYETLYKEMAAKIKAIQPEEGLWHSSLLDPVAFPSKEASGSGFYCYGLAWGVNQGLLDADEYLPAVIKAWTGLVDCVHPDGKLGYVQPIGADPRKVRADKTEIYGVGAFLLAGSEVYKIAVRSGADVQKVIVENPTLQFRDSETVSLDFTTLKKSVPGLTVENAAVFDFRTNRLLVTQVIEESDKAELLFQTFFTPGQKKYFWVMKLPPEMSMPKSKLTTYGRFVPERKDDFAWENDKIAFRMYGKALEDETISSGIDVWTKNVNYPVIDKWYKGGDYHKDHGEGGDFYKVGPTLGCGGSALSMGPSGSGSIQMSKNFSHSKVIADGPIRFIFELEYDQWPIKGIEKTISKEIKRISLDLGSNLNQIECRYYHNNKDVDVWPPVCLGIVTRAEDDPRYCDPNKGIMAYWLNNGKDLGHTGCGVILPGGSKLLHAPKHMLFEYMGTADKPLVYYTGACWDRNEEFNSFEKWKSYLADFKERIDNPVTVQFAD